MVFMSFFSVSAWTAAGPDGTGAVGAPRMAERTVSRAGLPWTCVGRAVTTGGSEVTIGGGGIRAGVVLWSASEKMLARGSGRLALAILEILVGSGGLIPTLGIFGDGVCTGAPGGTATALARAQNTAMMRVVYMVVSVSDCCERI